MAVFGKILVSYQFSFSISHFQDGHTKKPLYSKFVVQYYINKIHYFVYYVKNPFDPLKLVSGYWL